MAVMDAVVAYGPGDYRLAEVPVPEPGDAELLMEVKGCGICAGDIKCFDGGEMFWGGGLFPSYVKPPVVAGHEFYGKVVEIGDTLRGRTGLKAGDYITSEQIIPCGECRYCRAGKYWMCEAHNIRGFQKGVAEGGMAKYMKLGERDRIHLLPTAADDVKWTMTEPLACAIHVVQRAGVEFDDCVVLAGLGPIGLCILQLLKLKNPRRIIALDVMEDRLLLGRKFGADVLVNPQAEDAEKKVRELTEGYGCDIYINNSGSPKAVVQGLGMLRKLGRYVEFSVFTEKTSVDWSIIGDRKELDILGAHLSPYTFPAAIEFLNRGVVRVDEIITHTYPIKAFRTGFETARKKDGSLKVALIP